jgi:acyl carrier protein
VNRQEIEKRVVRVITEQLQVPEETVKPESVITHGAGESTDLCVDSLGVVELLLGLEEEFGIEIDDDDAAHIKTVKDIVDFVESHT